VEDVIDSTQNDREYKGNPEKHQYRISLSVVMIMLAPLAIHIR
jgi:hypothetical protein